MKQIPLKDNNTCDLADRLREVQIMSKLRHPNISRYHNHFKEESMLCMLFEYGDKGDLETYLNNIRGSLNFN